MTEARSRRELPPRPRPRPKTEGPGLDRPNDQPTHDDERPEAPAEPLGPPVRSQPTSDEEDFQGVDAEINNRYEEIKRGSTHIGELQQMTILQLLKIAKEEGLTEYTGLKKQDLIFKVLKERVKQNGLMFGEGTLEVLPDGFGFLRS